MSISVGLISFGFGHDETPPEAHVVIDVRRFRDASVDGRARQLTGAEEIQVRVMESPGVPELAGAAVEMVLALRLAGRPFPVIVAFGCVGGRNRSVVIAEEVGARLRLFGVRVVVEHRDVDKPVIERNGS